MKKILNIFCIGLLGCAFCAPMTSCSSDDVVGDAPRNWAGTTEKFETNAESENGFGTFFTPKLGRVGDPMPFYDKKAGEFKVLYLQEFANNGDKRFHPFWGVATGDGCNYRSLGEVLPYGETDYQQDAALGTGCAYYDEKEDLYYIYYTGHNGLCKNREVVMRATSKDFKTWTKDNLWALNGPDYGYWGENFRDPQIFVADDGAYRMLIVTAPKEGKPLFVEFKSTDLKNWTHVGSFKMIWNDRMCECPDVFKMGNYWYMVFSEAPAWSRQVKYVRADSWENLKNQFDPPKWIGDDENRSKLDSRAFYAGKTASNGTDRFIWGWCPFRSGSNIDEKNMDVKGDKEPNWSGALVCHKILQHEDGSLSLVAVPGLAGKYNKQQPVSIMASQGYQDGKLTGDDAFVLYSRLDDCNHLAFTVKTAGNSDKFGVSLVRSNGVGYYYTMVVNPEDNDNKRKVNFEQNGYIIEKDDQGKEVKKYGQGFVAGIDSYMFPRPADNTYKVDIYTDNNVVVMYINDNVCYTQRIYGVRKNCWSINNYGGSITVSDVKVSWQ